ncbi:MAG TPA: hypothetical protein IAC49_00680, partial [Candidatus Ventricola intestinavium]|nr:hypothetical protein [Candidatus Ventricola intestinavium]
MATKIPAFTYTGTSSTKLSGGYWYLYLKTSGTLKFSYTKTIDVFLVGGGGAGGNGRWGEGGGGGGGGYTKTVKGLTASAGTGYRA